MSHPKPVRSPKTVQVNVKVKPEHAAAVRTYAAQLRAGEPLPPVSPAACPPPDAFAEQLEARLEEGFDRLIARTCQLLTTILGEDNRGHDKSSA